MITKTCKKRTECCLCCPSILNQITFTKVNNNWKRNLLEVLKQKIGPVDCNLIQRLHQKKNGIVVMSLFDGISTGLPIYIFNSFGNFITKKNQHFLSGLIALKLLGIKVRKYYASEICPKALAVSHSSNDGVIEYIGDAKKLTKEKNQKLRPNRFIIGRPSL